MWETYKTQAPPTPPICVKELDNLSASPDIHFFEFCNSLVLNIFIFFHFFKFLLFTFLNINLFILIGG